MALRLKAEWEAGDGGAGCLRFALSNDGTETVSLARLVYSALVRLRPEAVLTGGARLEQRVANAHTIVPQATRLAPGAVWRFSATGLSHAPQHRSDGPKSAYAETPEGTILPVAVDGVSGPDPAPAAVKPALGAMPNCPLAVTPRPTELAVTAWGRAPAIIAPDGSDTERMAARQVGALAGRLFPAIAPIFGDGPEAVALEFARRDLPDGAYRLTFGRRILLAYGDVSGLRHGLVTLAQAAVARAPFAFPLAGHIADAPRFGWRGCHLDVCRHFWAEADVTSLIDILAWLKMNRFHWHLTEDEAWRIEIPDLPALTEIGAWRGPGLPIAGQHGYIDQRYGGFYSVAAVRRVVAHGAALGVDILPEIDMPGHSHAALTALPHLRDPDEAARSYVTVQGYHNNALNPGVAATFGVLDTVLGTLADLFPFGLIHAGGDEVPQGAWMGSPLAREVMTREGLAGTYELQAWFMRRVQEVLAALGRGFAGWDEVAKGGGIAPDGAVVMAWQGPEVVADLARAGYDVIACPGQATYLDMTQGASWEEPGLSWGGVVPASASHAYDPLEGLDAALHPNIKGVQACIWSENLTDRRLFNHMVFPRLGAVAETAWCDPVARNWAGFSARAPLLPRL